MPPFRWTSWAILAAGLALAALTPAGGGGVALLAAVLGAVALCMTWGLGLLRVMGWQGPWHAVLPAAVPLGLAGGVVLASLVLLGGMGAQAQGMALVVTFTALALAALLAPAPPVETPPGMLLGNAVLPFAGAVLMAFPLVHQGAWSVAGHDLDTLQHQDGALHAVMTLLASEGQRPAPGYPLGVHAFLSGMGHALGWTPFQALCVGMPLFAGALVGGTQALAAALGAGPGWTLLAGALVAMHPVTGFAAMEQFAPQLCAAALIPAAVTACLSEVSLDRVVARAFLPALLLAGLLDAYPLALGVALPLCVPALLARPSLRQHLPRAAWVLALCVGMAPLGVARLSQRMAGSVGAANPVSATAKATGKGPQVPQLAPSADSLGEAKEAASALTWEVTGAHLAGVTPYRDHFLRTARLAQAFLGGDAAALVNAPLWAWANAAVPVLTLLWALVGALAVGLLFRARRWPEGWMALACIPLGAVALWLSSGGGIRPYYAFKVASLLAGPVTVLAVTALVLLPRAVPASVLRGVALALVVSRVPPALAVQVEYGRALALDAAWTAMVDTSLVTARGRAVHADDPSATRRYWNRRFLFARARETGEAATADVVFCARQGACVPPAEGRLVLKRGRYALWAR